jgi:hypothetical protein
MEVNLTPWFQKINIWEDLWHKKNYTKSKKIALEPHWKFYQPKHWRSRTEQHWFIGFTKHKSSMQVHAQGIEDLELSNIDL